MGGTTRERGLDLLVPVRHLLDPTPEGRGDRYASLEYSRRGRARASI
jgi:hypothetical protein